MQKSDMEEKKESSQQTAGTCGSKQQVAATSGSRSRKKIVVIGAGPGGYVAALRAAALGGDVTIIEKEHLGGTCLNWGCIPSKIIKTSADTYLRLKESHQFGIKVEGTVSVDMRAIMARKERIVEIQRKGILSLLEHAKVSFERGRGYIKGKGVAVAVDGEGNEKEFPFDTLIIATGTAPLNVPAFPFDGHSILSSNDLLNLNEIPQSIVIVGGGVIGCEFACILSALGSSVTVVEAMSRVLPLPGVDESCSATLQREMKKRKIKVITERVVQTAEKREGKVVVTLALSPFSGRRGASSSETAESSEMAESAEQPKSAEQSKVEDQLGAEERLLTLEAEKMAVCIGRSPLTRELGLENIGLKTNNRGWIEVNERMETSVPGVYAIGDILGPSRIMLAHVASHEGMVAAQNALGGDAVMDYHAVPGAIFTMPEIGNVGLTESVAASMGLDVSCSTVSFRTVGKAHAMGEIAGEARIVAESATGKILGVHITGPHATDLIAEGALAVNKGLTLSDIANTIHAHPTLAEIMSEVALKGAGMALHG